MDTSEVLFTGRVDFQGGGTLDGPLLTKTLFRLRVAEGEIADLRGSITPVSSSLVFINYVPGMSVGLAITGVLVVQPGVSSIESQDFSAAPTGTIYRFGNETDSDVSIKLGLLSLLILVPGEYARLVRLSSGWLPLSGI